MELADLLQQAKDGSSSALGRLLEQFRPQVVRQAAGSVDSRWQARADQSDLAQLTLATAAHAFAAFRGSTEPEFAAWLKAILQQHVAAMTRLHLHTDKRSVVHEVAAQSDASGVTPLSGASGLSPSRLAFRGELRGKIEQAIQNLPFDQREAVRLRFLDEWSTEQIARFLEKSDRAVAGLLRRGLSQLRESLHDLR